jgi:hypothetical protein
MFAHEDYSKEDYLKMDRALIQNEEVMLWVRRTAGPRPTKQMKVREVVSAWIDERIIPVVILLRLALVTKDGSP